MAIQGPYSNQPIRTIRIEADTWEQAGKQYYDDLGSDWLKNQIDLMYAIFAPTGIWDKIKWEADELALKAFDETNLPETKAFLQGGMQSETVKTLGLSLSDLNYLNNPSQYTTKNILKVS